MVRNPLNEAFLLFQLSKFISETLCLTRLMEENNTHEVFLNIASMYSFL